MSCANNNWEDDYSAYLENDLPADRRAAFQAHLDGCAECQRALDGIRESIRSLMTLPAISPPAGFSAGVMQAIRSPQPTLVTKPQSNKQAASSLPTASSVSPWWLRVAAGVAVLLVGGLLGRTLAPQSKPLSEQLTQLGLQKVSGGWVDDTLAAQLKGDAVYLQGEWLSHAEAQRKVLEKFGSVNEKGEFISADSRKLSRQGLVFYQEKWVSPKVVAQVQRQRDGMVKVGDDWLPERIAKQRLKGNAWLGNAWYTPATLQEKILTDAGLTRAAKGAWRTKVEREKLARGLILQGAEEGGEKWLSGDDLAAAWLREHGYALRADGRWQKKIELAATEPVMVEVPTAKVNDVPPPAVIKKPAAPNPKKPPVKIVQRPAKRGDWLLTQTAQHHKNLLDVAVKDRRVPIRIWDNATVDGDILSIQVNGKLVLEKHYLRAGPVGHTLRLALGPGINIVTFRSESEGKGNEPLTTIGFSLADSTGARNEQRCELRKLETTSFAVIVRP